MKLDPTLHEIFQEVQQEIYEELGIEVSIQEIADIVESQFHCGVVAINHGAGIRLPFFGSFYMKAHLDSGIKGKALNELYKHNKIDKKEYERRVALAKEDNKRQSAEAAKKRRFSLTLKDLLDLPYQEVLRSNYNKVIREFRNGKG